MMMIQLDVDIITQLGNVLPSSYDLIIPSIVIDELNKLKKKAKGKDKLAANVALKIAKKEPFIIENYEKNNHVDNMLLDICNAEYDVLCTNDKILRQRARGQNISVIYLRQHRYLEVDGYIKSN